MTLDQLERLVLQLTGNSVDALERQMVSRFQEQTFVGGKRVTRQELPGLPKDAAFEWHDYHLHAFETVCGEFGSPDQDDDWAERQDETAATLAQVAGADRAKVVYSYDFGDDWRHDIVVEKIIAAEPGVAYPRCTGGRRDGPPEDCGGIWVFNEQFADLGDLFTVGGLNERLADLATVLIPAR